MEKKKKWGMKVMENLNLQLLIFDMDGLILDTERIALKSWEIMLKEYEYQFDKEFLISLFGTTEDSMEARFKNHYGQDFPFEQFRQRCMQERLKMIEQEGETLIKYGLTDLLNFAKTNKIQTAVATSTVRSIAEKSLKLSGLLNSFDTIVCGDEIKNSKPQPDIFLKAAEKANVSPENAIVLEDSSNGIKAASNANMRCIWIKDIVIPSEEVLSLTWAKPQNLKEVILLLSPFITK